MLETVEGSCYIARHGDVNRTVGVVPGQCEPTVQRAVPVGGDGVEAFEGGDEVLGVGVMDVLDAEIIDDQGEHDAVGGMMPKRGCMAHWSIAGRGQMLREAVTGKAASLFKAGHAFPDLHVDIPIAGDGIQVVVLDDFSRDDGEQDAHVFEAFHGGAVIKILYVECHKLGVGSGEDAIEQALGGREAGTVRGGGTREVKAVATNGDADSFDLSFVRSQGRDKASIGDFAISRNGGLGDEKYGVSAGRHAGANTLGEAAKVVG